MTFVQAIVIGLIQGIAELFPVSSLGQTVLIPSLFGGSWSGLVAQQASPESPYLAFVVGLHVATSVALIAVFWREWVGIVRGFFRSLVRRRVDSADERLAWFIVVATIPVGVLGLVLEHPLRTLFAKPLAAATFLTINGLVLLLGEWLVRRSARRGAPAREASSLGMGTAFGVGVVQSSALLAGISRDGVTMVAGLSRGLTRQDAARLSFLLSAPPIFAAGLYKLPDLMGPLGHGIRPQILAGSAAAFVTAFLSTRLLMRYFRSGTLLPFAAFCLVFGVACIIRFGVF